MLARVIHILPLTHIRRQRTLPVNGRVLVRTGQKVAAGDIIAEAKLVSEHSLLDISRGLDLPADKADKLVERQVGDLVSEGDVIARKAGMFARLVRVPKDGKIVAVGGGQVLIEIEGSMFELRAGLPGVVSELIPDRGAIIETKGALIQGVWGNNRITGGVMSVLMKQPADELTPDQLDVSLRGAIIVAGYCGQADIFKVAVEIPLRALVFASLAPELIPAAAECSIPIIVLEGFGQIPMNETSFKILSTNDRRDIAVNAAERNPFTNSRPELVIPLPAEGNLPDSRESAFFTVGQNVRLVQSPGRGKIGKLVALLPGLTPLPCGVRAQAAVVRLSNGDQSTVPLANLEVIV
jgi:hypothetical protein